MDKSHPLVAYVKAWVDQEYEDGRVTVITDDELIEVIQKAQEELGVKVV